MEIFLFLYFSFFWFSNMILSDELILSISQLQQVMTSQFFCSFLVKICETFSLNDGFLIRFIDDT